MIIDTHCHIENVDYDSLDKIISKLKDYILINNGVDTKTNKMVLEIARKHSNFYAAIGYHPENIEHIDNYEQFIEENITDAIAIGEIGLDYHYRDDNKEEQKALFISQLKLAKKYNKPVIIHARDAIQDTLDILKQYPVKADLHCFSSSVEMAREFIKIGCYIGVGGTLTFKNSKKLVEVVKEISINKILLETDSPYLAPEPVRGTINDPTNLKYVISKIAEIKGLTYESVRDTLNQNAIEFFGLKI